MAECEVYLSSWGVVVRCRVCHNIGIVLVEVPEIVCVDPGGLSELPPDASDQRASQAAAAAGSLAANTSPS